MAKGVDFFTWDTHLLSVAQLEGEMSSNTRKPSQFMGPISYTWFAISHLIAPICRFISFSSSMRFNPFAEEFPIQLVCLSNIARHSKLLLLKQRIGNLDQR